MRFNRDLPFDQFVVEQIAGDLLPGATPAATGRYGISLQHHYGRGGWKREPRGCAP